MEKLLHPYSIFYPEIAAVVSEDDTLVELIETFDCIGGAMWSQHHYRKSPLVKSVRTVGSTSRYMLKTGCVDLNLEGSYFPAGICGVSVEDDEVAVSYRGMGGGGVGASVCRAGAKGVLRHSTEPCGGGKVAGSTISLPKLQRVIIGIDDTDTPDEGATWTLAHNIARAVEDESSRYLSHTVVQLFPVPYRTKNCVGLACEFASANPEKLADDFQLLLEEYTLSEDTGMAVFTGFDPSPLAGFGKRVKKGEVSRDDLSDVRDLLDIRLDGRGIIGAVASIPYATHYREALSLWDGKN